MGRSLEEQLEERYPLPDEDTPLDLTRMQLERMRRDAYVAGWKAGLARTHTPGDDTTKGGL